MEYLVYLKDHYGNHVATVSVVAENRERALHQGWIHARKEFTDIDVCQIQAKEN